MQITKDIRKKLMNFENMIENLVNTYTLENMTLTAKVYLLYKDF